MSDIDTRSYGVRLLDQALADAARRERESNRPSPGSGASVALASMRREIDCAGLSDGSQQPAATANMERELRRAGIVAR